jgi:HEAT repeat protein
MMLWILSSLILTSEIPPAAFEQNLELWTSQLRNPSVDIRINAIQRLAELKSIQSVPSLGQLASDSSSEVRFHAVQALAKIPHADSLAVLKTQFSKESDPYVRGEVRRATSSLEKMLQPPVEATPAKP